MRRRFDLYYIRGPPVGKGGNPQSSFSVPLQAAKRWRSGCQGRRILTTLLARGFQ